MERRMNDNTIDKIYLIEKIWFDSFENHAAAAIGYSPYAFVSSKEDAEKICSEEIENPSWTNQKIVRKYTYREIFKFSEPKNLGELNESK